MIRPFRLLATLVATLALALGVSARLVRAEADAAPAAVAYRALAARLWASHGGPLSPQPVLVEKLEA